MGEEKKEEKEKGQENVLNFDKIFLMNVLLSSCVEQKEC
jgi:hypothetical protein